MSVMNSVLIIDEKIMKNKIVKNVEQFTFKEEPLSFARQHPSYGDCLEVKRE